MVALEQAHRRLRATQARVMAEARTLDGDPPRPGGLDVLAQQIVAEVSSREWQEDALLALLTLAVLAVTCTRWASLRFSTAASISAAGRPVSRAISPTWGVRIAPPGRAATILQARGAAMTGGLYNVSLRGTGYVAVTTKGEPVALDVSGGNTFVDPQAAVLWTAGTRMDVRVDTGGIGSLVRGGTGETFQMAFSGQGYVLVQPSESVVEGNGQGGSGGGGGASALGSLLS